MSREWSRGRKWTVGLASAALSATATWAVYRQLSSRRSVQEEGAEDGLGASSSGRDPLEDMLLLNPQGRPGTREQDAEAHLAHHFDSIQDIADTTTMPSLLPALGAAVTRSTGVQPLLERLRAGVSGDGDPLSAADKLGVWEELKVASLAQLLLTTRLLPLLALTVRCQLNVLGRYLYLESALDERGPGAVGVAVPRLSTPSQERFLSFADHLAREGHARLLPAARRAAAAALAGLQLHAGLDGAEVLRRLSAALEAMSASEEDAAWREMVLPSPAAVAAALTVSAPDDRALLPGSEGLLVDAETVEGMLGEVRRTLDSACFARVAQKCTAETARLFAGALAARMGTMTLPLAKVIPVLVAVADEAFFPGSQASAHLSELAVVKELAAMVYASGPPQD
ncbi:PEX3 [Auxenochlorella protothecoides x Auxenochlorella symbiontica]